MRIDATASHPAPMFVGDHLAMDFLNSVALPESPVEWLRNGSDLVEWLERAGAVDAPVAQRFRAQAGPELDAVAAQARALREWFRGLVKTHAGRALTAEAAGAALAPLNQLLARDDSRMQVLPAGGPLTHPHHVQAPGAIPNGLTLTRVRRWTTPEQLLQPIALAMADLVTQADFRLVKACESHSCTLMFLDRTKAHARRWCSMAVCGNRAKAAAHRARARRP
ncbi:CGNR zinc finger domain-containing protein [Nitrospirillum sp. BR 11163]|uniref:CGNR zinc finger domain-containing protein n=1 Tax=Nitrospirillum sp. BR 11163 TaxID=3104323 RepID=UPI002B001B01|nr:ABATE domain-containing protein [Nitrospirillum sp. BR 11163]MEA1676394.1 CGNR zinc finger domain-containing protein [Nitrospirillum sp. BR 11163]